MVLGVATVERVLGALADHGGRGHVAAGLAEHAVVQQHARDGLAARRGVQHLLQALVHHVAVALEREHDRVREHALHAGRDRRRAAVQRLHEVDVDRHREARVAADAGTAIVRSAEPELLDRLEVPAQRQRLAAPRAQVVRPR